MANPIKTSDIYVHSNEINILLEQLDQLIEKRKLLQNEIDKEVKSANELQTSMKKLTVTTSTQRDEIEAGAKQADEISKRYKKFTESLDDNAVKIAALKDAQRRLNQINKLEAKLITEKEGSYNRLSAQYSINKLRLNQMSKAERSATKEGQDLVKTTNEIYQEMKKLQEETGKHVLSVGDYEKGTKNLLAQLDEMPGALSGVSSGIKGVSAKFKALLANPVVLVIAAIAGSLIVLFNAFKRSEKGAELMAKATGLMNGLMSGLVSVAVKVAEAVEFAFSNPKEAIVSLGKAIVNNIVNRFKGLAIAAVNTGKAISEAFKGNFEEAKKAAQDAITGVNQIMTGLDADQQSDLAKAIKQATEEVIKETNAFIALESAKRGVRRANRALVRSIEELTTAEELSNIVADDTTKSFKEREAAAEAARKAIEGRAAKEIQLAKNNLSLLNREISLRRGNGEEVEDLLDRQLEGYRAVASAERQLLVASAQNDKIRSELQQDRLERDLDILIDGFDNQKTINERRLRDDQISFGERLQLLDETRRLSDESFAKQIETIEQFTDVAVNANDLIAESDSIALNQKIRGLGLSEIIEGRLLEIVRERRLANQDLAEAEVELSDRIRKAKEAEAKAQEEALRLNREQALETFDQDQALKKSEFDLLKSSERQKTEFRLEAEKDRLQKILELNEEFGSDLSALQLETIKNQIAKINGELEAAGNQFGDIYDVFGLNVSDDEKEGIKSAFSFAKDQLSQLTSARVEAANAAVQAANTQIAASQRALEIEIQNRNAGFASNVETQKRELDLAKANQKKALKEQEKAKKAQLVIQSIEQGANLVTASTKIFAQVGFPFAIPLIAAMFGAFIGAKAKAFKLAKTTFGDGGMEIIGGGSHASGNDTYLGFESKGKPAYAQRGEANMTIPVKQTRKYKSILPSIFESLRKGTFEDRFAKINTVNVTDSAPNIAIQAGGSDMSKIEGDISIMRKNSELRYFTNSDGKLVEQYKNRTRIYV